MTTLFYIMVVFFYCRIRGYCDTASFVTAPPELVANGNDLLVKGYLGYNYTREMWIVLEIVTWYEARDICQQHGFGLLENTTHTNFRQSIITGALNEAGSFSNVSMWTAFVRTNVTNDDWMMANEGHECHPTQLEFDSWSPEYHCAINRYEVTGQEPKLEMRNCSDKLPFVCMNRLTETVNFTKYSDYDITSSPTGASLRTELDFDLESCIDKCKSGRFCVGFSYSVLTGECRWVRADFGVQALQYEIFHSGTSAVSHYVKMGHDVMIVENSTYVDELNGVEMSFECETDNPTSSTTSSRGTTSLTLEPEPTSSTSPVITTEITATDPGTVSLTTTTESETTTTTPTVTTTSKATTTPTATSTISPPHTTSTLPGSTGISTPPPSTTSTVDSSTTSTTEAASTPTASVSETTNSGTTMPPTTATAAATTTNSTSSTTGFTSVANTNTTECLCLLNITNMHNNVTADQVQELLDIIIQNLTIKRKETYNYKITLECAEDDRPSARVMGVVAAIVMCFVFGPIVIADVFNIVKHFSFIHNL